ncbi:MAG: hypothetical protein ACW99F_17505 [Candidatus Hodarchaeales archaeon]|jgi:hypothetical protein
MQKFKATFFLSFFVLFILLPFFEIYAGAWVQPKKGYYFKISTNYLFTREEFNHKGEKRGIREELVVFENPFFRDFSIIAYLEYGLFEKLSIVSSLPFKVLTTEWTSSDSYTEGQVWSLNTVGFADLQVHGKYALMVLPMALSIQAGAWIPLGYERTPENNGPRLGTGEFAFEGNFLFGKSLYPMPLYFSAGLGYRVRGGRFNDEILLNADVGYTNLSFIVKVYFEGVKSTVTPPDLYGQPVVTPIPGGGGVVPEVLFGDQDYFKINPSIIFKIKQNMSLQFEVSHTAFGRDIISGTSYSVGLVWDRR